MKKRLIADLFIPKYQEVTLQPAQRVAVDVEPDAGISYRTLLRYFFPELVSAFLGLIAVIDAQFIAQLTSTSLYAAVTVTSTLFSFLAKIAEGISVGTVIICGQYNGAGEYARVGHAVRQSLIIACTMGILVAIALYSGAEALCHWYGIHPLIILQSASYIRLRAVSIFLMFIFFALIGFLRGIKNTKLPMQLLLMGGALFLVVDYILIFGLCGVVPPCGLYGSAIASIVHYVAMIAGLLFVLLRSSWSAPYFLGAREKFIQSKLLIMMLLLMVPIMCDKAVLALAKIVLSKAMALMGTSAVGAFGVLKDLEQIAFVPALACAQIVTFLVSNEYKAQNWPGIRSHILRTTLLSVSMVTLLLILFACAPRFFIGLFDKKGAFTDLALCAFPLISLFVCLDIVQLILAAALRGASDVRTVMMVRATLFLIFFMPVVYLLSCGLPALSLTKFTMIYATFYITTGIMSIVYMIRLRGHAWKGLSWSR